MYVSTLLLSIALLQSATPDPAVYDEENVPEYTLPDPLVLENGTPVNDAETWFNQRRTEILELFREHVYGRRPGPPEHIAFEKLEEDVEALEGVATMRRVNIEVRQGDKAHAFELIMFVPNAAESAIPIFLLMNNRERENTDPARETISEFWPVEEVIARGYAIAAVQVNEIAPDNAESYRTGVISLFEDIETERPADAWGGLAAWGWGASRILDYFEQDDDIDETRVVLLGHSRGGKAALWGGAEDDRFAIAISNESGCGGAALSRRRFGERISHITAEDRYHYWFCRNFQEFAENEDALPIDQHMLFALMAPRPVYAASAVEDRWADPKGEFLGAYHATPVYALLGLEGMPVDSMPAPGEAAHGTIGYHIREGGHNLLLEDWNHYMDFADKHFNR